MSDQIDIERLRELLAKATPEPWETHPGGSMVWDGSKLIIPVVYLSDGALIVELRNQAPALLDELERLKTERDALQERLDAAAGELKCIYDDACQRYGKPETQPNGKVRATNGFMAEMGQLLVVMGALNCLPEPWKLESSDESR